MDSISNVIKRHQEQREIIELSQLNALSTQNLSYPFDKMTIVPKFWNMYKYRFYIMVNINHLLIYLKFIFSF